MPGQKFDFKKQNRDLYNPKPSPALIEVPEMLFLMRDGFGDPNDADYQLAVEALYAISYTISMSHKKEMQPEGFYEYVVAPLEGLWWTEEAFSLQERDNWLWTSMIRQPDFVTEDVIMWAKEICQKKKPDIDTSSVRLERFREGSCVQIMHIGPYAEEPANVSLMQDFIKELGYKDDTGSIRKHHEIYLSDPRRVDPSKMKTVLRHPIVKTSCS